MNGVLLSPSPAQGVRTSQESRVPSYSILTLQPILGLKNLKKNFFSADFLLLACLVLIFPSHVPSNGG